MKKSENRQVSSPEREQAGCGEEQNEAVLEIPMAGLEEFLARMGHELRTPLHAIVGFLDLAEDSRDDASGGEIGDYLRKARVSALTLLDLINNLLDLTRMERGELELDSTTFRLEDLLDEVTRTLSPQAHMKRLELEYMADPSLGELFTGDPVRIKQVLFNLAGNAVKFTSKGHVLIRAEHPEGGVPGTVRFSVSDSGRGIPEDMRERIFQSYVRVKQPGGEDAPGVGLGLSISHQLVAAMGGRIDLRSTPGEGSEFSFTLNLPASAGDYDRPVSPGPTLQNALILLAHPRDAGRTVYGEKLKALGAKVAMAANFAEAASCLEEASASGSPIRLALVDEGFKVLELIDFARGVRGLTERFQPDLIHLTSMSHSPDEKRLVHAGFTGTLVKPVAADTMQRYLGSLIARQTTLGVPQGAQVTAWPVGGNMAIPKAEILVVEDNVVSQKMLQAFLSKQGYHVILASNGLEAAAAVESKRVDLILMDLQMPEMDGLTATRRIRELESGANIPIIAMTAATLKGDRDRCLEAGMNDFSPKPILPKSLLSLIQSWLERSGTVGGKATDSVPEALMGLADLDYKHLEKVKRYLQPAAPERFEMFVAAFAEDLAPLLAEVVGARDTSGLGGVMGDADLEALRKVQALCEGFGAPRLAALARHLTRDEPDLPRRVWDEGLDVFRKEAEALIQRLKEPLFQG